MKLSCCKLRTETKMVGFGLKEEEEEEDEEDEEDEEEEEELMNL